MRVIPWLKTGIVIIWLFGAILRFWRLGQFNTLVFDEVYYGVFANNYLTGTTFFNAHPPLCQYIIAIGIWIGSHLPWGQDQVNSLAGSVLSTFSYRWINALTGSFVPVVTMAIAWQLTHRRNFTLIVGLCAAVDGLFLVESRYALSNIYLVIFGLLGQLYWLWALNDTNRPGWRKLTIAGIFLGASVAVKWNGLGFLLGIYLLWGLAWLIKIIVEFRQKGTGNRQEAEELTKTRLEKYFFRISSLATSRQIFFGKITQLSLAQLISYLGIIPALTYSLIWIPHLQMNPQYGFWDIHQRIMFFHQQVGGSEVHPYCSPWYSWIVMWRPIAYFYHTTRDTQEIVPAYPPLPASAGKIIYDVHAMGNPILWWFSTIAIMLLTGVLLWELWQRNNTKLVTIGQNGAVWFMVANYAANLLPWMRVSRCTFIYHYMSASVFAWLALAWILEGWLTSKQLGYRFLGAIAIILIMVAFWFWLPIYLGLPLSPEGYKLRMFFPNWV